MPFVLPGLFDFVTGVSSSIEQTNGRLINENQVTNNYLNTLNAFNASLNTNDNLELRQGFAEQPAGTSILDRFSNFAQQSTNPFAVNQALTAGAALSPLAALTALRNPQFGIQQGLPLDVGNQLAQGLPGFNALFQQQFNQQLPQTLALNNPGLNAANLATVQAGAQAVGQDNAALQAANQQVEQMAAQIAELLRTNAAQNTARSANDTLTTTQPRLQNPLLIQNRPGTQSEAQIGGSVGSAASRTGN